MLHVLLALMLTLTTCADVWTPAREGYRYDGDGVLVKRTLTTAPTTASYRDSLGSANANWTATTSVAWGVNAGGSHTTTLQLAGNGTDWANQVYRSGAALSDGATARLAFKLSQTNSQAVLAVESGDWTNYVGVYEAGGTLYLRTRLGASFTSPVTLTTGLLANTWYGLEISLDDAAGTRVSVWQEGQEGTRHEARYEMPRGLSWRFHTWIKSGTVWLDGTSGTGYAYQEERPSGTATGRATHLVGQHYEDTPPAMLRVKRYYAGGTLLATRQTYYGYPSGTELTYVQGDHLGSTSTLTNSGGNVVARERYAAFGERRRTSDTVITDQLYTGQRLNVLSHLYHYSDGGSAGRFYDPLLARFLSPDKATPPGSQGLSAYAYTLNNPLKHNDPDGNLPHVVVGAVVGAGVAYGFQVATNLHNGMSAEQALTQVNWARVGAGAAAGAVGAATFGVGTAIMGTGIVAEVGASALSNVVAGQVAVATENALSGQEVTEGLGNGSQILGDAVLGSAGLLARPGASIVLGAKAGDTALARSLGEAGEAAAGISGIKNRIPSLSRTARYRVPDEIINAEKIIREVKNVSELSYTKQLRDYVLWAKQKGYTFELLVRENGGTTLSQPLIDARNNGDLIIREVLP